MIYKCKLNFSLLAANNLYCKYLNYKIYFILFKLTQKTKSNCLILIVNFFKQNKINHVLFTFVYYS